MTRAVLFDAIGTLIAIEPPAPHLQRSLAGRLGCERTLEECAAAMRAEGAHYRAHCISGRDEESLAALRLGCAGVLARELGLAHDPRAVVPCLLDALHFSAYPDVASVLCELSALGYRLAVVSNMDCSLSAVLAGCGIGAHFEAVVDAATTGWGKPHLAPFERALTELGCAPEAAVHVGDDPSTDVEGARLVGIRGILLDRSGSTAGALGTLAELGTLLAVAA